MRYLFLAGLVVSLTIAVATAQTTPAPTTGTLEQAKMLVHESPKASAYVFAGTKLPTFEFKEPQKMREVLGAYTITATFYNAKYQVVTEATDPGRYGAVVEIKPAAGGPWPVLRRFITLYRTPQNVSWWRQKVKASIELPEGMGVDPKAAARQSDAVADHLKDLFADSLGERDDSAVFVAGLAETPHGQGPVAWTEVPWRMDQRWWLGLKRKLYGYDKLAGPAFVCPRPNKGEVAPVLRPGTAQEAGLKPEGVAKIDALLTEWAAHSDEAFNVVIARHGVVVLDKAYGTRDGKPMTVDTPSELASLTKMVSGAMLLTLVDQGLIELDKPVTELPGPLQGVKTSKPLTFWPLYTHSSGFEEHWGDWDNDMEERVAVLLPRLPVGQKSIYNGEGMALAWKFASCLSGETYGDFAVHHLLGPLGCAHTEVGAASFASRTTARDLAKICQMLVNKGAYGDQRFFRAQSLTNMLPQSLDRLPGYAQGMGEFGLGTIWYPGEGLSDRTFGHEAASSATARMDLMNDLVITMCRNNGGRVFYDYHPRFIRAVSEALIDPAPTTDGLAFNGIEVPAGQNRLELHKVIKNTGQQRYVIDFEYKTKADNWKIEPASGRVEVAPGKEAELKVVATLDPQRQTPLPTVRLRVQQSGVTDFELRPLFRPSLRRKVTAVRLATPPKQDGVIDQDEYGAAPVVKGFAESTGSVAPPFDTEFRIAYDDKALYIAVVASEKGASLRKQPARNRDGEVYTDDAIELFLDTAHQRTGYRQFIVNAAGVQFDLLGGDALAPSATGGAPVSGAAWNATWTSTAKASDDRYIIEYAFPLETLGVKAIKSGDVWGLNICRDRVLAPGEPGPNRLSQWTLTYGVFLRPALFGDLVLE